MHKYRKQQTFSFYEQLAIDLRTMRKMLPPSGQTSLRSGGVQSQKCATSEARGFGREKKSFFLPMARKKTVRNSAAPPPGCLLFLARLVAM